MSLYWGSIIFLAAFLIHVIVWKIRLPEKQTNALLLIFFLVSITSYCLLRFWGINISNVETLRMVILYIPLVFGYIITYSALEVDSPSLVFIKSIADAGSEGISKAHFNKLMSNERLIEPRLNDLLRDNFATKKNDKYLITKSGKIFVNIFIVFRKLLNAPKGG